MVSLHAAVFLVALDRAILGSVMPSITNQFDSIIDIGWYSSAYMLTSGGFVLFNGRLYKFYLTKSIFLSAIFLFKIGSAICGASQNSTYVDYC